MVDSVVQECLIPLVGERVWARNAGLLNSFVPFVPAEVRDVDGDEVLLKINSLRPFKRWVARKNVYRR